MKLKDDDIVKAGDRVHCNCGCGWFVTVRENSPFDGMSVRQVIKKGNVDKVTRHAPRISRKEWKRRALEAEANIRKALQYIADEQLDLDLDYCQRIAKILRGEK